MSASTDPGACDGVDASALDEHRRRVLAVKQGERERRKREQAEPASATPGDATLADSDTPIIAPSGVQMSDVAAQRLAEVMQEFEPDPALEEHRQTARKRLEALRAYKRRAVVDADIATLTQEMGQINSMQTDDDRKEDNLVRLVDDAMAKLRLGVKLLMEVEREIKLMRNRRALSYSKTREFQQKLLEVSSKRVRSVDDQEKELAALRAQLEDERDLNAELRDVLAEQGIVI